MTRAPVSLRRVDDAVFEVPYQESVRMLTQQASALDGLRARSSTILASAALMTTLFGGSLGGAARGLNPLGWAAIGALFGVLGCTPWVLYPWSGWQYGQSAAKLIEAIESAEPRLDLPSTQRATAIRLEQNFRANEAKLARLSGYTRAACILTAVEAALWMISLEVLR